MTKKILLKIYLTSNFGFSATYKLSDVLFTLTKPLSFKILDISVLSFNINLPLGFRTFIIIASILSLCTTAFGASKFERTTSKDDFGREAEIQQDKLQFRIKQTIYYVHKNIKLTFSNH